jgi:hypothetical protein
VAFVGRCQQLWHTPPGRIRTSLHPAIMGFGFGYTLQPVAEVQGGGARFPKSRERWLL